MAKGTTPRNQKEKKITRYTYDHVKEPRTPETGHTPLLPAEGLVVTVPMDNGWRKAIVVGKVAEDDGRPVVDLDPAAAWLLFRMASATGGRTGAGNSASRRWTTPTSPG